MKELINKLSKAFDIKDVVYQRENLAFVTARKEQLISVITHLRDMEGFAHFVMLTCADWLEDGVFQLTYILNDPKEKCDIAVRCMIERENATMTSAHHLWKQVATYQRELKEMFGIDFPGSPRVDENFILEGWVDMPPMRRDFDTIKYSDETYDHRPRPETNDPAKHMEEKLHPKEWSEYKED
jgi:NADH-quinone oxidoreductase subunit C